MGQDPAESKPMLGGSAIKPEGWDRSGWEAIRYGIYNPETGAILSRTPQSWARIVLFYCVYYVCLSAFWLICLQFFFLTIPVHQPRWLLEESLIGNNPGVGLRPRQSDARIDSSIFVYRVQDKDTVTTDKDGEGPLNVDWARRMDLYMKTYSNASGLVDCTGEVKDQNKGKCIFDKSALGDCSTYPYGYLPEGKQIKPCLFLKLNKIFDFVPKSISPETLTEPEYDLMSEELKDIIRVDGGADNIYFDCQGRFPGDKENLHISYFPANRAISSKYFPYRGGNYQAPLVAVKVETKSLGQMLHIECRAWFEGVFHETKDKAGLVQFEVLIE